MLRKLIPVFLAIAGLGVGAGAGLFLRPTSAPPQDHGAGPATELHGADTAEAPNDHQEDTHAEGADSAEAAPLHDYVKLNNQFIVPVVENGRVAALVILSLSLEITSGMSEQVYMIEPKLRDAFLQVMFDHANAGGFGGTFTDGANLILLREALKEVATGIMGKDATDVLIVDIVRQDN